MGLSDTKDDFKVPGPHNYYWSSCCPISVIECVCVCVCGGGGGGGGFIHRKMFVTTCPSYSYY